VPFEERERERGLTFMKLGDECMHLTETGKDEQSSLSHLCSTYGLLKRHVISPLPASPTQNHLKPVPVQSNFYSQLGCPPLNWKAIYIYQYNADKKRARLVVQPSTLAPVDDASSNSKLPQTIKTTHLVCA
jgi:hypothetical protein